MAVDVAAVVGARERPDDVVDVGDRRRCLAQLRAPLAKAEDEATGNEDGQPHRHAHGRVVPRHLQPVRRFLLKQNNGLDVVSFVKTNKKDSCYPSSFLVSVLVGFFVVSGLQLHQTFISFQWHHWLVTSTQSLL